MQPRCSSCQGLPEHVGPLCLGECPWEPGRQWFQCRACVVASIAYDEEMRAMGENLADRAAHYATCAFCWSRKGLILPGPLAVACFERRREQEREALLVVA